MQFIKIEAEANGAHSNFTVDCAIDTPEGYAIIPEEIEIPNTFPFVNLTVEDGIVTSITAAEVPPEPEYEPSDTEVLNTLLGVTE